MHSNTVTYIMMYVCTCVLVYKYNTQKDFFEFCVFLISKDLETFKAPVALSLWPASKPGPQLPYSMLPIRPSLHSSLLCPGCFLIQIIGNQLKKYFWTMSLKIVHFISNMWKWIYYLQTKSPYGYQGNKKTKLLCILKSYLKITAQHQEKLTDIFSHKEAKKNVEFKVVNKNNYYLPSLN